MRESFQDGKWKTRGISIGEFEDIWGANTRLELAESLITSLKSIETITKEDKVGFLVDNIIFRARNWFLEALEDERSVEYRLLMGPYKAALAAFFDLVPVWPDYEGGINIHCGRVLRELNGLPSCATGNLAGKIKIFIRSYLNTNKKEDIDRWAVGPVMVKNQMFEELLSYDFTSDEVVKELWSIVFPGNGNPILYYNGQGLREKLVQALRENREPHAVSTLLRILAKRGDLEKIFRVEGS